MRGDYNHKVDPPLNFIITIDRGGGGGHLKSDFMDFINVKIVKFIKF
jgi:hypothetical protein